MSVHTSHWNYTLLIVCALMVHVFLLASIFEVYFTSAVVPGLQPQPVPFLAPAKRLVLIVADGLRADKIFSGKMERTPFLREIMQQRGTWGVSHTRVPTESRPGHVAIIAGFYEDVASVTKGWQENAVEFDSVFNRSGGTWSWGSPDILPMFLRGAKPGLVRAFTYSSSLEDFAAADTGRLDTWVFDRVEEFLSDARRNHTLYEEITQDRVVFFLHLLGLDTSGHAHKPYSESYLSNMALVDRGVGRIEGLIEDFFPDRRTAFLFTADHGMTEWGSHGAGSLHETLTPVVAWGAGVRTPRSSVDKKVVDQGESSFAHLHLASDLGIGPRVDVRQADLCPLMAALIGCKIPTNSVGEIPLKYLDVPLKDKAEMAKENCLQILEQFKAKRMEKRNSRLSVTFKEFAGLHQSDMAGRLREASALMKQGRYDEVILLHREVTKLALEGIDFFHKYDRVSLGICIGVTFVVWTALVVAQLVPSSKLDLTHPLNSLHPKRSSRLTLIFAGCMLLQGLLMIVERRPWAHWLFHFVPLVLGWLLVTCYRVTYLAGLLWQHRLQLFCFCGLLEIMIWSFFYRGLLSIGIILIGFWPYIDPSLSSKSTKKRVKLMWLTNCCCLAVFPLLPVIGGYVNLGLVMQGSGFILATTLSLLYIFPHVVDAKNKRVIMALIICLVITSGIVCTSHASIRAGSGLPVLCQIMSWTLIGGLPALACSVKGSTRERLLALFLALSEVYVLLSIAYETLFFYFLSILAFLWTELESPMKEKSGLINNGVTETSIQRVNVTTADVRRAVLFVYLLVFSFFGTGNIASINSFDPSSVYCFVTVFKPFTMGGLMMVKIFLPMLLVSLPYASHKSSLYTQTCLVMVVADFAALHFFCLIRDYGSWLEIGTGISHYILAMAVSVVAMLFTLLARWLLTVNHSRSALSIGRKDI